MVTARAKLIYSPGDTVLVSNDSRSGSKGNKVIVKKINTKFTTFTSNHRCLHQHVLPRLRAPNNTASTLIDVLETNLQTMQDEMKDIVFAINKLNMRMIETLDLIEDVKQRAM